MDVQNNQIPTIAEVMSKSRVDGARSIVVCVFATFLLVGVVYTGLHNFNLFSRALPADQRLFALIPVVLLEGGIVAFLAGSFVWFSGGAQKLVATVAGWALFGIVAANTLIDSLVVSGQNLPDWLQLYATFGLYSMPVVVMAIVKLIFDLDPAKRTLDMQKAIEHGIEEAKFQAAHRALAADSNRLALGEYGEAFARAIAERIRQSAPVVGSVIEGTAQPAPTFAKDASAEGASVDEATPDPKATAGRL